MIHISADENSDGPFSQASLAGNLRDLGLGRGDVVIAHVSIRALGWTAGGGVALLQALRDVIGAEGTLVAPSFTTYVSDPSTWTNRRIPHKWWTTVRQTLPPFDPELHAAQPGLGRFPELLRSIRSARRSHHPVYSFTAHGPHAESLLEDHPLPYGLGLAGPLGALRDIGAKTLLIGVGWDKCTALHLGEHLTPFPGRSTHRLDLPIGSAEGSTTWCETRQLVLYEGDFGTVGNLAELCGIVNRGTVGAAQSLLCPIRPLTDVASAFFMERRDWTRAALPGHLHDIRRAEAVPF